MLGARRGGQPLDVAGIGMLTLQCGRDDQDRSAVGQMDIKNYHDCMSRYELWKCMRRRHIAPCWCAAALRLQRCPIVTLGVRSTSTGPLGRSRGALAGNSLAPWFGRILVEDVFVPAECVTSSQSYRFLGIGVYLMAWSDNIVVFGPLVKKSAACLSAIANHIERKHLRIKEGFGLIAPASARKLVWESTHV